MALGHDPEWRLEIVGNRKRIIFTSDSVTGTFDYAIYGPTLIASNYSTSYMAVNTDHQMSVVVQEKFCQDRNDGKAYGTTVTVWFDDKQYYGCGDVVHSEVVE